MEESFIKIHKAGTWRYPSKRKRNSETENIEPCMHTRPANIHIHIYQQASTQDSKKSTSIGSWVSVKYNSERKYITILQKEK
jgi:hypothetical protein